MRSALCPQPLGQYPLEMSDLIETSLFRVELVTPDSSVIDLGQGLGAPSAIMWLEWWL
jgi:hypothetical protein